MARVLSRKAHEATESEEQRNAAPQSNNPDVPPLPRLRYALNSALMFSPDSYEAYQRLVSGKADFTTEEVENLSYWVCEYVGKLRQWMGKSCVPLLLTFVLH